MVNHHWLKHHLGECVGNFFQASWPYKSTILVGVSFKTWAIYPEKRNMEPKNHPIERKIMFQTSIFRFKMLLFRAVIPYTPPAPLSWSWYFFWWFTTSATFSYRWPKICTAQIFYLYPKISSNGENRWFGILGIPLESKPPTQTIN